LTKDGRSKGNEAEFLDVAMKRTTPSHVHATDSISLPIFRKRLLAWYREHQRELPWRETRDPYLVWISEIMLQQTQVATVLPYYARFITRFPSVVELAEADEAEVLRYWEGLGYYRRARQLHAAAKKVVHDHDCSFPDDFASVLALPGVGRYTAGAICSFAFDQATPIVEANTQRLYARLMKLGESLESKSAQTALWEFAARIVERGEAREINQAVMELGALVCVPKPKCDTCPLSSLCPTFQAGLQSSIPAQKKKTLYEDRFDIALIVRDRFDRVRVRRCGDDEWWTGLWDFPRFEIKPFDPDTSQAIDLEGTTRTVHGEPYRIGKQLFRLKHGVTKYRITLTCFSAEPTRQEKTATRRNSVQNAKPTSNENLQWVELEELESLALNASARKVALRLIKPHAGQNASSRIEKIPTPKKVSRGS
jgi:A/G-specific adenine glycosylase